MISTAPHFMGLDFGTSGTRCCVIDPQGNTIATSRTERNNTTTTEQNPQEWWFDTLTVIEAIPAEIRTTVEAVAVDGTSGTVLLCNSEGQPLTTALMYHDNRATEEARHITAVAPRNSGAHGAGSSLAKCLWLLSQQSDLTDVKLLHQADWISNRLCNQWGHSDYNNALKLGYDPVAQHWPDWLQQLDIAPELLPQVNAPGEKLGNISREIAMLTGLSESTRVVAGTTDSIAAFIATGAAKKHTAVTSLGSTLVLKIVSSKPVFAPEFGIYSHRFGNSWLAGGASNSGGAVLKQFFNSDELQRLSDQINPAIESDLNYYPLAGIGERFPINNPNLESRITPRPQDDARFLHGLLESMARIEKRGYELLDELGAGYPEQILTCGGGASNKSWTEIRQRLLGCNIYQAEHSEAAYGAARIAASIHLPK